MTKTEQLTWLGAKKIEIGLEAQKVIKSTDNTSSFGVDLNSERQEVAQMEAVLGSYGITARDFEEARRPLADSDMDAPSYGLQMSIRENLKQIGINADEKSVEMPVLKDTYQRAVEISQALIEDTNLWMSLNDDPTLEKEGEREKRREEISKDLGILLRGTKLDKADLSEVKGEAKELVVRITKLIEE